MDKKPTYDELEKRVKDLGKRVKELESMLEKSGEDLKWDILTILAREWDANGPPGIVENRDLIQILNVKTALAETALAELESDAITSNDAMGFVTYLTPEGYDIAKKGDRQTPLAEQIRKFA